jgi:pimeloyl-ACP methyl ester carboxylesterase
MGVQASPKETSGGVGRRDHFAGEVRDREIGNCGDDTGGSDRNDDVPRSSSYAQRNRGAVASAWADHGTTDSDTCWLGGSKDARYDRVVTEGGAEQVHPVFAAEGGPVACSAGIAAVRYKLVILDAGSSSSGIETFGALSDKIIKPLAERSMMVCAYDRAGTGETASLPNERRTVDDQAEELNTLLAAAEVPTPRVFVGSSWGGFVAVHTTRNYPDGVGGLVLLDVPAGNPHLTADVPQRSVRKYAQPQARSRLDSRTLGGDHVQQHIEPKFLVCEAFLHSLEPILRGHRIYLLGLPLQQRIGRAHPQPCRCRLLV